jgi:heme/copper-type cytochrome/quinol oxidase subunit 3
MFDIFLEALGVIGIILSSALYFVPTLVGYRRQDKNLLSLFVFNLLLGFTFVGWVIALAYAARGITFPSFN